MSIAVILNYNDAFTTRKLAELISNYDVLKHIIIVDNCSSDDSYRELKKMTSEKIDVIRTDRNGGYGYGNNFGIRYAWKKYKPKNILICNPDVEVSEKTIERCEAFILNHSDCAIVAPLMLEADCSVNMKCVWKIPSFCQYLLFSVPVIGKFFQGMYYPEFELLCNEKTHFEVGCVAGSLLLVDAEKMLKYGMYDEHIFLYCEETELGLKFHRANLKTYLLTKESFVHHHSVSINKSIRSKFHQAKIMWKSRLYVLNKYYVNTPLKRIWIYLVAKIALMGTYIIWFITQECCKGRKDEREKIN